MPLPIPLLPVGPRQFLLRHAYRRGDLFTIHWNGLDSSPPDADFVLALGVDSLRTAIESLRWALEEPAAARFLHMGCALLLDCSSEAPGFNAEGFSEIHELLGRIGIAPRRVVLAHHNAALEGDYRRWLRQAPGREPMQMVEYHFYLQEAVGARILAPTPLAQMRAIAGRGLAAGTRKFVCLNNRAKDHRVVVLGHLARAGLLDEGIVSFRLGRYGEDDCAVETVLPRAEQRFPAFAEDIAAARALLPRLPLVPTETAAPDEVNLGFDEGFELHAGAFLALVTESDMRVDIRRFTEKTLKPLAHGMPFVVAGNPGTLALLRSFGFQTFAPAIDEGYDAIPDRGERLAACLQEFRRLAALEPARLERLWADLWPVLAWNMEHFAHGLRVRAEEQLRRLVHALGAALNPP
jgi:hypothetical protein